MKRTKSNDNIPADELALAKLLQTANALGLKGTRVSEFRAKDGFGCEPEHAVACCALGASYLDPDDPAKGYAWVARGNDTWPGTGSGHSGGSGYDIGAAFSLAMDTYDIE